MPKRLSLLSILLLSACMVGPDYQAPTLDLPSAWNETTSTTPAISRTPKEWWTLFNDPVLTALEEEGLKANADLLTAAANVARARANLQLADANQYPELDAKANADRTATSKENAAKITAASNKPANDYGFSAVLSYEVDLWGKLRRASESARAQLLAQQSNRDAIYLAVSSDIATSYFNLLALDAQIRVTQQTIAARKATLDYQTHQYKEGAVDALTYRQAEAELAAAEAALPTLQQSQTEQQNALAILLGRTPKELLEKPVARGKELASLPKPPAIPLDAPSTLLERRPDIHAAEQSLISANAEIGVATAGYFPTLSLSALIGLDSRDLDHLFTNTARNWSVGGAVAAPLIDMGRTDASVESAKASRDVALISYQQTVRTAFAEVLNALSSKRTSDARVKAETKQVTARAEAARIVKVRYDVGYANNLDRLDADRNLYQAQLDAISATRDQLTASVTLYKALGGGWEKPAR